ncbi:MAG: O-methyltransferase [Eubacterium sp.]|nr:O-methyltransferase [Eubacterium sp.]
MTDRQRVADFIRSFGSDESSETLRRIEEEAAADQVPIIREATRDLLNVLLKIRKPLRILEVGTAIGFSALFMAERIPDEARITTIENYPPRIERARANIRTAGREDRICLLAGDAADILKDLEGPYDFIFMDAAKGQYIHFFPEIMRLLAPSGILLSDNVLQDGDIYESRYAIRRRNHTIHSRMREYLYVLTHSPELDSVILECGDGAAVSVRK